MAKGNRRRSITQFRTGERHSQTKYQKTPVAPRPIVRPDLEDKDDVHQASTGELTLRDLNGQFVNDTCVLRPRKTTQVIDRKYREYLNEVGEFSVINGNNSNLYGLLHLDKTTEFFNDANRQHRHHNFGCIGGLVWDYPRCINRGVCKEMNLKCDTCSFKTEYPRPLYHYDSTSVKGRPAAAPNKSLQVALARQGIGPKGLIDLIHGMHMEAPALSGLYKSGAQTTDILVDANQKDMGTKLEEVQQTNVRMGRPKNLISLEADGMYNNPISSGVGKTPFQAASQATFLGVENVTRNKYIVHAGTYNKLCHSCSNKGQHDHVNCTRNLNPQDTIGNEGLYLKNAVNDINAQDCYVTHVTLDGDSNANKVARTLSQKGKSRELVEEIEVHRCVRHLSQSVRQQIRNLTLSKNAFPAAKTAEQRAVIQKRFALDIVLRCNAEATSIVKAHVGDKASIQEEFRFVPDYVLSCYMGDCTECLQRSRICTRKKPWHRPYLSTMKTIVVTRDLLEPSDSDLTSLRQCLEKRFNTKSLSIYLNKTTNKSEGTNRAILKSVPRHITFSRCFPGRVHAAVHSVNNKSGLSMLKLCRAVGATLPDQLVPRLKKSDKRDDYIKAYKKSCPYKQKQCQKRHEMYELYDNKKEKMHYNKFMVDKSERQEVQYSDHSYYTLRSSKSNPQ